MTADLMAVYFVKCVQRLARRHAATGKPTRGFALACGTALAARIREATQRDREAVEQSKRADDHMRTAMRMRAARKCRSVAVDRQAADAGRSAAAGVGLHRQANYQRPLAFTRS